jgi:antitoxin (DNA-binding transcriptional repressor) of toxin-antitoxin stability system
MHLALDMARFLAYSLAMKIANIGELKDNISKFIGFVEQGEVVEIRKRNVPVALIVPHDSKKTGNYTKLGCGKATVQIKGDLTEPLIPEDTWDMHRP